MKLLEGKVAIITGASRGIGKGIAEVFAQHGANVAFTYSSSVESAMALENELNALGIKAKGYQSNAADFNEAQTFVDAVIAEFGTVDILINNAGISLNKPGSHLSEKEMNDLIDINFKAVFRASQAYYKSHKQIGGNIINIASVLGLRGFTLATVYSGTKGAVIQLTLACAAEWIRSGFRLNAICPGFIDTDMVGNMKSKEALMEGIKSRIPMGRMGKPEELLGTAIFLASDASSYINAQTIVVDGGMTNIV